MIDRTLLPRRGTRNSRYRGHYDRSYYTQLAAGSLRSARVILPWVLRAAQQTNSCIDVGCGVGAWARAALELGVTEIIGVDGDYVSRDSLLIAPGSFVAQNLAEPLTLERRFDLAVCMEVAEHLPEHTAPRLVDQLVALSDVVLFSAAIPYQGGAGHVNERWPSYWAALFAEHGYEPFDVVRPRAWANDEVEYWYAQNALLYVAADRIGRTCLSDHDRPSQLDVVHPRLYSDQNAAPDFIRVVKLLPRAASQYSRARSRRLLGRTVG